MKLSPCPFCGSGSVAFDGHEDWVMCIGCEAIGPPGMSEAEGADLWNRRALADLLSERVHKLGALLRRAGIPHTLDGSKPRPSLWPHSAGCIGCEIERELASASTAAPKDGPP